MTMKQTEMFIKEAVPNFAGYYGQTDLTEMFIKEAVPNFAGYYGQTDLMISLAASGIYPRRGSNVMVVAGGIGHAGRALEDETAAFDSSWADVLTGNQFHPSVLVMLDDSRDVLSANDAKRICLKQEVSDLLKTAGQQDWDGADALALDPETVALAQGLLDTFPSFVFHLPPLM